MPSVARAEDTDLTRCLNSPTGSEQKRCTQELFQQAAEQLKQAYAGVVKRAIESDTRNAGTGDDSAVAATAESQRAWEVYRDAECKGVAGRGGGSGRMVWVFGCLAEKTRERIRELNAPFYRR